LRETIWRVRKADDLKIAPRFSAGMLRETIWRVREADE
jgi:hypothetical protein